MYDVRCTVYDVWLMSDVMMSDFFKFMMLKALKHFYSLRAFDL